MSSAIWYHFNWSVIWRHFDRLIDGLLLGLEIAVVSLFVGCLIGLVGAFGRLSRARWLSVPVAAYVETIRNVPLLLLAYISYYALPIVGIDFLSNTQSFILALSVYSGAYLVEVFRAGLAAVAREYHEAGKAIGLGRMDRLVFVTLPLMLRIVLPTLSSTFISLFKDTSIAAAIAVPELTWGANWINVNTFRVLETWTVVGLMYFGSCYLLALSLRLLERRFAAVR